ncbi:hypothetical protein DFH29DRAFT_982301 [Suillus ampliporus]|nr:hypothetical protein DFH29DRAFT_982301 [Suillus ampliporus]
MPSLTQPECGYYISTPATKEGLEFADLAIIDLSKAHTPEGRAELCRQLRDAQRTHGFVYAINHGYSQAQRDRIFDIADVLFTVVPPDEMKTYTANIEKVRYYEGFKGRQFWKVDTENHILDQIEHYGSRCSIALHPLLPEVDAFTRHNHFNIVHPILRLIALSFELPEEILVEKHKFDGTGKNMFYRRMKEEEEKSKNVWMKGRTDIGSVAILWSQPVGGLQIQAPHGRWKWVSRIDNALPPEDQRNYDRLGVFYFSMSDDNVRLLPYVESPVLQNVGIQRRCPDKDAPLCVTWRKGKSTTYGRSDLKKGMDHNVEEEVIEGIVVKHYN